jgi:hypothetical protein
MSEDLAVRFLALKQDFEKRLCRELTAQESILLQEMMAKEEKKEMPYSSQFCP